MINPFRVGCESFLEGSHGDRAHVRNDAADHRALHHYAGLNFLQFRVTHQNFDDRPPRLATADQALLNDPGKGSTAAEPIALV